MPFNNTLTKWVNELWYPEEVEDIASRSTLTPAKSISAAALLPGSIVFNRIANSRRKKLTKQAKCARTEINCPIVIVGNISVGGCGKTPLVMSLIAQYRAAGKTPGVISRGYGATVTNFPHLVEASDSANFVGDEPKLINLMSSAPVVIDPDRVAATKYLLSTHPEVDIIISDDGLQHYALPRDYEIVVVDAKRQFGNGKCLPAGPLREPIERLKEIDLLVINQAGVSIAKLEQFKQQLIQFGIEQNKIATMQLQPKYFMHLASGEKYNIDDFVANFVRDANIDAVAGIGDPQRFFNSLNDLGLNKLGLKFTEHAFADHHQYSIEDFNDCRGDIILITSKDAVKCRLLDKDGHNGLQQRLWILEVEAGIVGG